MNITHQNNVAMRSPTPMQSTNITYRRNFTKPQKPSLSTKAKPTEDAENKERKTVNILHQKLSLISCMTILNDTEF
jgi:hypothetical protein